jgi:hypothetical protein
MVIWMTPNGNLRMMILILSDSSCQLYLLLHLFQLGKRGLVLGFSLDHALLPLLLIANDGRVYLPIRPFSRVL